MLSDERKKEIEAEEKKAFQAKRESVEEIEYRQKVRERLQSGGLAGFFKKTAKDILSGA